MPNGFNLNTIAEELNARAQDYLIGELQEIRFKLKNLSRRPGRNIFNSHTIQKDWAFHFGGRSELQYNIGHEDISDVAVLRHGVAFSLKTSRSLPTIDVLIPKVRLFNDFIRLYPGLFSDMRMWHYDEDVRSSDYMPAPIPHELAREGVFVFLGKSQPIDQIDYHCILSDFDRLLPIYKYVESAGVLQPVSSPTNSAFIFRSGCVAKLSSTVATPAQQQLDVALRHNIIQQALHSRLASQFGVENVGTELGSGVGTSVDVVVRQQDEYWFYEIKTALSPRACIREAVGQLLEYSFWPGAQEAKRLVIVGETAIDHDGKEYLSILNNRFSLHISYEQIVV